MTKIKKAKNLIRTFKRMLAKFYHGYCSNKFLWEVMADILHIPYATPQNLKKIAKGKKSLISMDFMIDQLKWQIDSFPKHMIQQSQ